MIHNLHLLKLQMLEKCVYSWLEKVITSFCGVSENFIPDTSYFCDLVTFYGLVSETLTLDVVPSESAFTAHQTSSTSSSVRPELPRTANQKFREMLKGYWSEF